MSKLIIAMMRDRAVPGRSPLLDVPLNRRVEYALHCIEAEEGQADQARAFLHKVMDRIVEPDLKEQVAQALGTSDVTDMDQGSLNSEVVGV